MLKSLFKNLFSKKYNYPKDIYDMCIIARKEAKACIEKELGYKLKNCSEPKVIKQFAEKKINGFWSWKSREWNNMWVCGLAYKNKIIVGCNPSTSNEVNPIVLKHEMGHHWLINNFNGYYHDPKFKNCFHNWNDPIKQKFISTNINNETCSVDFVFDE